MSSDEECSVIGERPELGFIDYDDDRSVCSYNPAGEGDVHVSVPFPFVDGKPRSILVGSTASRPITINNTTSEQVSLWGVSIYDSNPENSFTVSLMEPPRSDSDVEALRAFLESFSLGERVLQPNETLTVWLSCKPKEVCSHTTAVHFEFETGTIERLVILLADDKISKTLASKSRYSKGSKKQKQFQTETFHRGPAPLKGKPKVLRNRLPSYLISPDIREILKSKEIPDIVREGLTGIKNYVQFFKQLIIMEELKLEEDMRSYDLENVSFKRRGNQYLALEVPGLAERRPSLVQGDYIYAKLASRCGDSSSPFQGYIHRVEADEVHLKFADEFHSSHRDGNLYNVEFTYNRVNMRRFYQGVDATVQLDKEVLFPSETHERRQITRKPLKPITRGLNEEQTTAIEMILGCKGGPPYVIHGPPGTGKTLTLVEAVLQLYKSRKNARIFVCAPSNSAADHILEKILKMGIKIIQNQDKIFRLNATARPSEEMNPDFAPYCYFEDGVFKCPPISVLLGFRIIISTYVYASVIHGEGIKRGHFTHIFLDEAGQASEPETMISVANLCGVNTVVVLAGDPIQLGPVIYSKDAESWGLGKSYLQRLFECECYSEKDEMYITKLVKNYRSHPEILHLPSEIFYQGELVACREEQSSFMDTVDFLPSKDFPLFFFGIQGCDEREGCNPSWFNRFEASKVVEMVRKLTEKGELGIEDIGVITPYRQQVHKIKMVLEHFDLAEVKVGSVEQFQGQEKQVIIMSTVRSTIKHNDYDTKHCLGFLSNPRRFNVAITRAISLLIIIGNPHIISKDVYWSMLLWRCIDNNSYQGCPPPKRQELLENEPEQEYGSYANEEEDRSSRDVNWDNNGLSNSTGWPTEVPCPTGWHGESSTTELPNPVTDEAEWSNGWK